MKVGMMLPALHSVALNAAIAQGMAQMKIDSLWLPDHLLGFWHPALWPEFPGSQIISDPDAFLDPFCVAAAIGGTTDLALGTCVTDTTRRRSIDLVRAALTLNDICRGGFILGVGSGETESTVPFGYDFSRPVGRLERTLIEIRSLLETGRMPGDGPGRTGLDRTGIKGRLEVWVGAQGGPRALGLAGRYGDGWLSLTYDLDRYREMVAIVKGAAAEAGRRTPTLGMFPVTFLGESADAVIAMVEKVSVIKLLLIFADSDLWDRYGMVHPGGPDARGYHMIPHNLDAAELRGLAARIPNEMFAEFVMVGNAKEIASRLQPFADAGLEYVVLADMSSLACGPEEAPKAIRELAGLASLLHHM